MIPDDDEHIAIFAGLTRQLLDWQRWERDPLKRGTQVAQVWREVWNSVDWTGEDCMGCCPEPTNTRYNSEGVYEESFDNGITWNPAPANDSRMSGTIAPPLAGVDGETKRCEGAASAQEYVRIAFIEDLTVGATIADLGAAGVAIAAALGVTGVGILFAAAAAAIFIAGVSFVQAAFTSGIWEQYKCILYCRMLPDASFDEAGWQAVKADIADTFTGVVETVLYNWVNTVGSVGLTNSARGGYAATADCSGCTDCPSCTAEDMILIGTLVSRTETEIVIDAVLTTYNDIFAYWIVFGDFTANYCCLVCSNTYAPGLTASGWSDCDGISHDGTNPNGELVGQLRAYSTAGAFTATYRMYGDENCP